MNALEWIVMIEAVLLVALILFSGAGYVIARNDPDDPIVTFCRTFWHEFLHPPIEKTRPDPRSPESHFVAPTSLRDVEPSVPLWLPGSDPSRNGGE